MTILPATGGNGNPWIVGIREGLRHVADVEDWEEDLAYEKARELINRIESTEAATSLIQPERLAE